MKTFRNELNFIGLQSHSVLLLLKACTMLFVVVIAETFRYSLFYGNSKAHILKTRENKPTDEPRHWQQISNQLASLS